MYHTIEDITKALEKKEYSSILNGNDYDTGAVEAAQGTADNAAKSLFKLMVVLIEKKIIAPDEAAHILQQNIW
jgi:hypothetical protein